MRRTALGIGVFAVLVFVAMAVRWSAPDAALAAGTQYLYFVPKPNTQQRAPIRGGAPGTAGRTWGYWGGLTGMTTPGKVTPYSGSYRATCVWLADPHWGQRPKQRDSRMLCTVLLSFKALPLSASAPNGGSLVLQGLVKRPPMKDTLFAHPSRRKLAITGGTGPFRLERGYADLGSAPSEIKLTLLS